MTVASGSLLPPRLESCYFATGAHGAHWPRLARVLSYTSDRYCHGWQRRIIAIPPPTRQSAIGSAVHAANAEKQIHWANWVESAQDSQRMLLIDTDTIVLKPLDDVWSLPFDVAYTQRRQGARFPLNGGVVFLRVSDPVRRFMRRWADDAVRMLGDPQGRVWRGQYGGIAQAALAMLLEANDHGLAIRQLPCVEWNCEDSTWSTFDRHLTRIVHIKSALRKAMFNLAPPAKEHRPLMQLWQAFEAGALKREASPPPPAAHIERTDDAHDLMV